jgi:hypothetical protein
LMGQEWASNPFSQLLSLLLGMPERSYNSKYIWPDRSQRCLHPGI